MTSTTFFRPGKRLRIFVGEAWIERVRPHLDGMVQRGMITVSPVEIVQGGR